MIISGENPYGSPQTESRPARGRLNLVLFGVLVGLAVHIVDEARLIYFHGLDQFLIVMRNHTRAMTTAVAINLAWRAGTGAAVGALASVAVARRKKPDSN